MVRKTLKIFVILVLSLSPAAPLYAADPESSKAPRTFFSTLERSHDILSREVNDIAERIDLFLGGLRTCEDSSGSTIQVGASVAVHKNGDILFDHNLHAKLELPNTQDRFRFVLESQPDKPYLEPLSPGARSSTERESLSQEGVDITKLSAALQFIAREQKKWSVIADGGIQVQFPPDPFARLRLRRSFDFGWWRLTGEETFFVFNSIGAGESTQIDLEMHLLNCMLLRGTTQVVWKERDQKFDLSQNLSLFQELSWREMITYKIGVTGETEPDLHMKDWGLSIEYRRRVYKNWLYITIEPALSYAKVNDFEADPSIRFSFDVIFGEKYVQ